MSDSSHPEAVHRSRRLRVGLSVQSKLLIMLLAVSLVAAVVVAVIGYNSGRNSLRDAAVDELAALSQVKATQLESEIASVRRDVSLQSRNLLAQTSSEDLNEAFDELQSRELSDKELAELEKFHTDVVTPAREARAGREFPDTAFLPDSNAGRWLQYHHTMRDRDVDPDERLFLNDADDGTEYSAVASRLGNHYARLLQTGTYQDILMLNRKGDVVFTPLKGSDLGMNVDHGPRQDTEFTKAYHRVLASGTPNTTLLLDANDLGPSIWVLSPIGDDDEITGVLAAQVFFSSINDVMTGDNNWRAEGLGDTGEVYLAGEDSVMRSVSRMLLEHPAQYRKQAISAGTAPEIIDRAEEIGDTAHVQPVDSPAVTRALAGETGTMEGRDYLGGNSLIAYQPLSIEGLDWVVIARIDTAEAFAPVNAFSRNVLLSLVAILVLVSILSLLFSQALTRPIKRLTTAVQKLAGGDLDVRVEAQTRDEFGELSLAFNDMAASLRDKQELIDAQQAENNKLLRNLMPPSTADRYRHGDETITEAHDDVSVTYARLMGWEEYARTVTAEEEVRQLNVLMNRIDEVATQTGVETVRTLHGAFLAASGLTTRRVDNVRRVVDFVVQLPQIIAEFNAQNGSNLALRIGVDSGAVTSGLVGRTSLAYDLWGDAVSLIYRAASADDTPGIYVSDRVRTRTVGRVEYEQVDPITIDGTEEPVWKVA